MSTQAFLLILAVASVGVLHTIVPDHWAPIVLIARQRGWSRMEIIRAAITAGTGHTISTLLIGGVVWWVGAEAGNRFGQTVDTIASIALVAFGLWIAIGAWKETHHGQHGHSHGHSQDHDHHHHSHDHDDGLYAPLKGAAAVSSHVHLHRHDGGRPHLHWHGHDAATQHVVSADIALNPPMHRHAHRTTARAALLIILGSSPMIEGLPAFFAAARFGADELIIMAIVFAASTIGTYVALCTASLAGLNRVSLGPLEKNGEIISGLFIAAMGLAFWLWSPI